MNYKYFIILLIFALSRWAATELRGQEIPVSYMCVFTAQEPVIDGNPDDPCWNLAGWSRNFGDIEGGRKQETGISTHVKMLWNDSCLFIAALLDDPHLWATLTVRDTIIYHDDDFEVFIDPDGTGRNYFEIEVNAVGTVLDLFLDKPYNLGGKAKLDWDCDGMKCAVGLSGTLNDPSDLDTGWHVEMAIPWQCLSYGGKTSTKPEHGTTWRMNFSRVEWDLDMTANGYRKRIDPGTGKPFPEKNLTWSPQGAVNMHIPEKWGYIRFVNPDIVPKFWVWMGGHPGRTENQYDSIFSVLRDAGITGILIQPDTGILRRIIPLAEKHGIEIHAWFWTMNRADADPLWLSVNRKDESLAVKKAYVDYYRFMCPALPEVRHFLAEKIAALADMEGLKGIHMDYIRYVDAFLPEGLRPKYGLVQDSLLPEFDYGYHPYIRDLFRQETGQDPMDLTRPGEDPAWLQFRLDALNQTVWMLRDHVRNRRMTVSAAVFPTPAIAREMVRQEWNRWDLDAYYPMVYHNFYNKSIDWIREVMAENRACLPGGVSLFCGLFLPALRDGNDLTRAMQAAMDGGATGISFFDAGSLNPDLLRQIRRFSRKRQTPE